MQAAPSPHSFRVSATAAAISAVAPCLEANATRTVVMSPPSQTRPRAPTGETTRRAAANYG